MRARRSTVAISKRLFALIFAMVALSGIGPLAAPARAAETVTCARPAAIKGTDRADLTAGLTTLVKATAACQTDGNWETYASMTTENYLGEVYGGGGLLNRDDFLTLTQGLPVVPVRFRSFDDLKSINSGEMRANVKQIEANQLTFQQITFREDKQHAGRWYLDSTKALVVPAPDGSKNLEVSIASNQFTPSDISSSHGEVHLHVVNKDDHAHEVLVLKLDEGTDPAALLQEIGPALPKGFTFAGQITIPAKADGSMVLVNLKSGTYALVDLLPDDQGVPYMASGMQGMLTVKVKQS